MPRIKKAASGKKKIAIEKIENEDARDICFSKRKFGLFKRASELSTLTMAETLIVLFSPAGRVYSLGCPEVEVLINRFLSGSNTPPSAVLQEQAGGGVVQELNNRSMQVVHRCETGKQQELSLKDRLDQMAAKSQLVTWYLADYKSLGFAELQQLAPHMQMLKDIILNKCEALKPAGEGSSSQGVLHALPEGMFYSYPLNTGMVPTSQTMLPNLSPAGQGSNSQVVLHAPPEGMFHSFALNTRMASASQAMLPNLSPAGEGSSSQVVLHARPEGMFHSFGPIAGMASASKAVLPDQLAGMLNAFAPNTELASASQAVLPDRLAGMSNAFAPPNTGMASSSQAVLPEQLAGMSDAFDPNTRLPSTSHAAPPAPGGTVLDAADPTANSSYPSDDDDMGLGSWFY